MTVGSILKTKGADVATITPSATLADAVVSLAKHKIGALVVTDPGRKVLGILSERDIIRALAAHGAGALSLEVVRVMTAKVQTCTGDTSVNAVMSLMTEGKFRHLPIVENEILVGIVSIGDIVKKRIADVENEQKALKDYIGHS
jgi:CBS domain-containing protein